MSESTSRRQFLNHGLTLAAGAALGGSLLAGCRRDPAPATPAAATDDTPRHGGRLRLGIVDGSQSGTSMCTRRLAAASSAASLCTASCGSGASG